MTAVRRAAPWIAGLVAVTSLLWAAQTRLDKAHMALAYLLLVLFGSSRGGRSVGIGLALLSFLCFNFFLLPPHYTFRIHDPLDWLVLLSFLLTAVIGAALLDRAQRQALAAEQRADEIDRLSMLGAETLNAGRAVEALQAIADVIRSTLDVGLCEIDSPDGAVPSVAVARRDGYRDLPRADAEAQRAIVLERGHVVGLLPGPPYVRDLGALRSVSAALAQGTPALGFLIPLRVRGEPVGMLRIEDQRPIALDAAARRFAEALCYYAALGIERMRLLAEAQHMEALREADRLKNAVLAAVSHDLRTPLTTIKALGHELLQDGDERAALIVEEADRLNRVVSDLLDLSRLNSGGLPVQIDLNPADDLVAAAVQQTAGIMAAHSLRARIPEDDILVGRFDPVHSLRALTNLIHNAVKYSPAGSDIDLTLRRDGNVLRLLVEDRGEGVAAGDVERIFEPFARIARVPDTGGSGLGLSIARRLAEAQGGRVYYEPREGGGSRFILELPAADLPGWDDAAQPE